MTTVMFNDYPVSEKSLSIFNAKLKREGECLIWHGSRKHGVSVQFRINDGLISPRRFSALLKGIIIPEGWMIRLKCNNSFCCEFNHINGDKKDNRLENLKVTTKAEHTSHHWTGVKRSSTGKPCRFCKILNGTASLKFSAEAAMKQVSESFLMVKLLMIVLSLFSTAGTTLMPLQALLKIAWKRAMMHAE